MRLRLPAILMFPFLAAISAFAQPATAFYYTGSPVSYITQGRTATVTPAEGYTFLASTDASTFISFEVSNNPINQWWDIRLAVPKGQPLAIGTYPNALSDPAPGSSNPGLSLSGDGAGDDSSSGFFTILEVTVSNGQLISFAADFTQYDEMAQASWNYGSIRYNSSIPPNVLPPTPVQPLSVACTNAAGPAGSSASTCFAGGGVGPFTWSFTNLPAGMQTQTTFPPGPGSITITGLPTSPGPFNYTVTVTDSQNNSASQNFSGTYATSAATCFLGASSGVAPQTYAFGPAGGSNVLTFITYPNCPWSLSSDIPGAKLSSPSGTISVTESVNVVFTVPPNTGAAPLTGNILVSGSNGVLKYPLIVNSSSCTYAINPASAHFGALGGSGSFTVTPTPTGCYVFAQPGVTATNINGTYYYEIPPNAGPSIQGSYSFGASFQGAGTPFTWQQDAGDGSLLLNCYSIGPVKVGGPLTTCSAAGGTPPYTWAVVNGPVPGGVNPYLSGTAVSVGSGIAPGPYRFTVRVTDSAAPTVGVATFVAIGTVQPSPPQITCSLTNGPAQAGVVYSTVCVPLFGTLPYQWSISSGALSAGALPAGLALSVSNDGSATISGVPSSPGSYSYTLQLNDSGSPTLSATQSFTGTTAAAGTSSVPFTMNCSLQFTGTFLIGVPMQPIGCSVSGGTPPFTWSIHTGELPPGMAFSSTTGSAVTISGTPTETVFNNYFNLFVKVVDSSAVPQPRLWNLNLGVGNFSTPISCSPIDGQVGQAYYSACPGISGARISAGALPPGLILVPSGIQGTPTTPGTYSFTISVQDQTYTTSATTSGSYTIVIGPLPPALNPANVTGTISHLAVGGGWDTTTVLVNAANTFAQANVNFFGDSGAPLPLPQAFSPNIVSANGAATGVQVIPAHGSVTVSSSGAGVSQVEVGSANVAADGPVGGFLRFSYEPNGQEVNVPLETRNAPAYVFSFDNTNGISTGVAVANLAAASANIGVTVRDDSGTQIGTGTVSLPAQGHQSLQLTGLISASANQTGTVEFDAPPNGQIAVLGIRFPPSLHFTSIPVAATTDPGNGIISQLAVGGGWNTVIEIINTSATASQAQLSFSQSDGTPLTLPLGTASGSTTAATWSGTIPAHGRVVISSSGPDSSPAQIGSATLTSGAGVSGFVRYAYSPWNQELIAPLETRSAPSYAIAFDNTGGSATSVAVANSSGAAANIPVTLYDQTGAVIGTSMLPLPAHGQAAYLLSDRYAETLNQQGVIQFAAPANGTIGVLGIRFPPSGAFTTIPPVAP